MNRWYIKNDYTDYGEQAQLAAEWLRARAMAVYERIKAGATTLPGDLNDNGKLDIDDVTMLIDYLLSGGSDINPIAADVDQSGNVSIDDVTTLIDLLLSGSH